MNRSILLIATTFVFFISVSLAATRKPNIIWIFSDDHSFQTIGAYGGRLQKLNPTPNIDKIASEGIRFDRCYVENSICGPSRACLLTGKFTHLHGKARNGNHYKFNQNQQTFPKILQKNGYQTALIGKIHLSGDMQGFDFWQVLPGQGRYNNPTFLIDKKLDTHDKKQDGMIHTRGYVTDIITDKALDWLDKKRDKSKPFMLMIHHKAAHRTWIPKAEDMGKYENITIPEPENLFDDYATRGTPAHRQLMEIGRCMRLGYDLKVDARHAKQSQWAKRNAEYQQLKTAGKLKGKALVRWKYQQYMKDYLRCIWRLDQNVGRVLAYLKNNDLEENTIVFYSSDQGFYMGEHGWFDKRFMYEESFRTPLIARWPGHIKPGSTNSDLTQNIDFAETFLDLAGVTPPDDMQGVSLVPLLMGKTPQNWRKSLYYRYYEFPGYHSVRKHEGVAEKRFKLIRFYGLNYQAKDPKSGKRIHLPPTDEWEFYDLQKDPHEMKNEISNPEYASVVKRMKKELQQLRAQYRVPQGDQDPKSNTSLSP